MFCLQTCWCDLLCCQYIVFNKNQTSFESKHSISDIQFLTKIHIFRLLQIRNIFVKKHTGTPTVTFPKKKVRFSTKLRENSCFLGKSLFSKAIKFWCVSKWRFLEDLLCLVEKLHMLWKILLAHLLGFVWPNFWKIFCFRDIDVLHFLHQKICQLKRDFWPEIQSPFCLAKKPEICVRTL